MKNPQRNCSALELCGFSSTLECNSMIVFLFSRMRRSIHLARLALGSFGRSWQYENFEYLQRLFFRFVKYLIKYYISFFYLLIREQNTVISFAQFLSHRLHIDDSQWMMMMMMMIQKERENITFSSDYNNVVISTVSSFNPARKISIVPATRVDFLSIRNAIFYSSNWNYVVFFLLFFGLFGFFSNKRWRRSVCVCVWVWMFIAYNWRGNRSKNMKTKYIYHHKYW